jgi:hypothetical protein
MYHYNSTGEKIQDSVENFSMTSSGSQSGEKKKHNIFLYVIISLVLILVVVALLYFLKRKSKENYEPPKMNMTRFGFKFT